MYNKPLVILGILVFLGLFTSPFWLNLPTAIGDAAYKKPELALPKDQKECIEPTEWILAEHMQLLNIWRDQVVREGNRVFTASNGKEWDMSLQNTCLDCHSNKAEFCDKCHTSMNVDPYCWRCHLPPKGNE